MRAYAIENIFLSLSLFLPYLSLSLSRMWITMRRMVRRCKRARTQRVLGTDTFTERIIRLYVRRYARLRRCTLTPLAQRTAFNDGD